MSAPRRGDQDGRTVATGDASEGEPGERHEVGNADSSRRDRPHVTENDERARASETPGGDAPVLPANASGQDEIPSTDQDFEVDEESAYDRRRSQDRNRPPSQEPGRP